MRRNVKVVGTGPGTLLPWGWKVKVSPTHMGALERQVGMLLTLTRYRLLPTSMVMAPVLTSNCRSTIVSWRTFHGWDGK